MYRDLITNEEVKARIGNALGPHEDLLTSEKTQTEVARARHAIIWTGQDYPTGNSSRRETKRQTEETMGRQHQRLALNGNIILRKAENLEEWRKLVVKFTVMPNDQPDYGIDKIS